MPLDDTPDWRTRRREVILAAADQLFAGRNYGDVQMDELARQAGVGKATLYRYFPSKEDLYLETLERALARLGDRLEAPPPADGPPAHLAFMVSALIDTFGEQLPTLKLLGGDQSDLAERVRRVLRRHSAMVAGCLRAVLEAGIASGHFRAHDTALTPLLIIGMVRGAIMMAGDQPRDSLERAILDLVLAGTANTVNTASSVSAISSVPGVPS